MEKQLKKKKKCNSVEVPKEIGGDACYKKLITGWIGSVWKYY